MKTSMIGLDIAKSVFEVCVQDERGSVIERKSLRRAQVLSWFARQAPSRVGVEACGGAHYWAREIQSRGHTVKIIPPQYVKPFVRGNKNDAHDAHGICRALREVDTPSVPIAGTLHQDIQALHRVRSRLIRERTALVNQARGLLLEQGIALPKRIGEARRGFQHLLQNPIGLSLLCQEILQDQVSDLQAKDAKIAHYSAWIERLVNQDPAGRRVMDVPGIGPLSGSALLLKVRHEGVYRNGRHFAASLGLVPRHEGTGGKVILGGISKRGDRYLRSLLIHGARAVAAQARRKTDPLSLWIQALIQRRGINKAVVALANKNARVAWHVIAKEEAYNAGRVTQTQAA